MTDHLRPEFTSGILSTYIGYHLQIFSAGRAKISLQTVTNKKHEFYTARPKRDRAGLQRQKTRSLTALPDHFKRVDELLSDYPDAKVCRLHAKGDNNATADNAHVIASLDEEAVWLVMSGVVHRWDLTTPLVHVLLEGKGKRTGEASIFNEYLPSYEHDWEDAEFGPDHYKVGTRFSGDARPMTRQPERPLRPTPKPTHQPAPTPKASVQPKAEAAVDYVQDDPKDDGVMVTDPPHHLPEEPFPELASDAPWNTKTNGKTTLHSKDDLWAQVMGSRG